MSKKNSNRSDGRKNDEIRPCIITRNYLKHPEGSVLIEMGDTKIIITASVEDRVPRFMRDSNNSWITATYTMLPRATNRRNNRDRDRHHTPGRTIEIQRLIGRSIRAAFNLYGIGECSIKIDCDVIQADGGTRCASITGAFVATFDALKKAKEMNYISKFPDFKVVAAISVGMIDGQILTDLHYDDDYRAGVDSNFVMNEDLNIVEIQGTSEKEIFNKNELLKMLAASEKGIKSLIEYQKKVLEI